MLAITTRVCKPNVLDQLFLGLICAYDFGMWPHTWKARALASWWRRNIVDVDSQAPTSSLEVLDVSIFAGNIDNFSRCSSKWGAHKSPVPKVDAKSATESRLGLDMATKMTCNFSR